MTHLLSSGFNSGSVLQVISGLAIGVALGLIFFNALWWNVRFFIHGKALWAVALHIIRFAALIAGLYLVARSGTLMLLAAALGLLIARGLVLRRMRSQP